MPQSRIDGQAEAVSQGERVPSIVISLSRLIDDLASQCALLLSLA